MRVLETLLLALIIQQFRLTKLTIITGTPGGVGAATEVTFDVVTDTDAIDEDDQTIVISLLSTAAVTGDMDVISYATAGGGVDAQAVKAYTLTILDDDDCLL